MSVALPPQLRLPTSRKVAHQGGVSGVPPAAPPALPRGLLPRPLWPACSLRFTLSRPGVEPMALRLLGRAVVLALSRALRSWSWCRTVFRARPGRWSWTVLLPSSNLPGCSMRQRGQTPHRRRLLQREP